MRNYDPSETADRLSWPQLIVIWAITLGLMLVFASSAFPAPAPFTCEQVQAFVHGKTEAQLQGVLAGMSQHERAAAAQCLQKPKAKPHSVQPVRPVQPVVVPIAEPAPVVVQPVQPVQPVAIAPAPKPKHKKGFLTMVEIILGAAIPIVLYFVMKHGAVPLVQKVLSWWGARKLLPTPQMIMDAFTDIEGRLVDLEKRFQEPAAAPEAKTITINEEAHGDAPEPAKAATPA